MLKLVFHYSSYLFPIGFLFLNIFTNYNFTNGTKCQLYAPTFDKRVLNFWSFRGLFLSNFVYGKQMLIFVAKLHGNYKEIQTFDHNASNIEYHVWW